MSSETHEERFYSLGEAAKQSSNAGKTDEAQKYAEEQLTLTNFQGNWNYGNFVYGGNLVLGRIALKDGQIDAGKCNDRPESRRLPDRPG